MNLFCEMIFANMIGTGLVLWIVISAWNRNMRKAYDSMRLIEDEFKKEETQ